MYGGSEVPKIFAGIIAQRERTIYVYGVLLMVNESFETIDTNVNLNGRGIFWVPGPGFRLFLVPSVETSS